MRLALFQPAFRAVGGAELLAAMQGVYFQSQGIDVKAVTFAFDPAVWSQRLNGIPVACVPKRHWTDLLAWTRNAKMRRRSARAAALLQECDAVLAYNFPCSVMLGVAPITARKLWQCNEPPRRLHLRQANPTMTARVEATAGRGEEDACAEFTRILREYDRAVAASRSFRSRQRFDVASSAALDEVYAISAFSRDNARRIYGRCRDEVIYPIVRFPTGVAGRHGLQRDGLRVLVHSRLDWWKNVDTIVRGFVRFRQAACTSAQLHVVGEGPHRPRLEALARELCPTAGAIHFHGFLPDDQLAAVYRACDVLALLPIDEPFGMVFPEAAAHGLLLVGPDHGGPLEILDGGRLGWVCDAFAPDAVADAFAQIWATDDAAVDRRRRESDAACRARYAADVVGPQLLHLLRELVR